MAAAGRSLINPHSHWNSFLKAQNFPSGRGESQAPTPPPWAGAAVKSSLPVAMPLPNACLAARTSSQASPQRGAHSPHLLNGQMSTGLPALPARSGPRLPGVISHLQWVPSPSLAHASREGQGRSRRGEGGRGGGGMTCSGFRAPDTR